MFKKSLLIITAIVLSALTLEPAVASGSMRCGTHIISAGGRTGTGMYEVLKKCGEPTERFGNTWVYKRGSTQYTVRFNSEGAVTRIE
ncbi:MAG: DUF2845 domain-containing protein [Gammaproteobacteria bacterium]|nr:DUF2845 domain-containing protein [Gammaproteobacteria bacterium]NND37491.1 DUF2845 domain-containing protein [Gammaproteobacteria bacterium]